MSIWFRVHQLKSQLKSGASTSGHVPHHFAPPDDITTTSSLVALASFFYFYNRLQHRYLELFPHLAIMGRPKAQSSTKKKTPPPSTAKGKENRNPQKNSAASTRHKTSNYIVSQPSSESSSSESNSSESSSEESSAEESQKKVKREHSTSKSVSEDRSRHSEGELDDERDALKKVISIFS
jgi:hypothetical protein